MRTTPRLLRLPATHVVSRSLAIALALSSSGCIALPLIVPALMAPSDAPSKERVVHRALAGVPRFELHDVVLTIDGSAGSLIVVSAVATACTYELFEDVMPAERRPRLRRRRTPALPLALAKRGSAGDVSVPCRMPAANLPIRLALGSGASIDGTTDASGTAVFLPPTDEPTLAVLRASIVQSVAVPSPPAAPLGSQPDSDAIGSTSKRHERQARPAFATVRDVLVRCGRRHGLVGTVRARLQLAEGAMITNVLVDGGPFEACVADALRGVHLPISRPPGELEFPYTLR